MTVGAISKYEAGRKPSDPVTAARLAEALKVRFNWLLRGEGAPKVRETEESYQVGSAGYADELGSLLAGTPLEGVLDESPPALPKEYADQLWQAMSEDAKDRLRGYIRTLAMLSSAAKRKSARLHLDLEALAKIVWIVTRDALSDSAR